MQHKKYIKCDFCQYKTASGCQAPKPDSIYCKDANNEFYHFLSTLKKGNK